VRRFRHNQPIKLPSIATRQSTDGDVLRLTEIQEADSARIEPSATIKTS
jgi:hypothetical protein